MTLYMRAGPGTKVMVMSVCNAQYSSVVRKILCSWSSDRLIPKLLQRFASRLRTVAKLKTTQANMIDHNTVLLSSLETQLCASVVINSCAITFPSNA